MRKSVVVLAFVLLLVCSVFAVIYTEINRDYYYSDGGPPRPGSISMAIGPSGAVYFTWDVGQWDCGGHNMQGIWLGKVDGVTNEFLWRKRISEDCCPYDPVIVVNETEIVYVIYIDGTHDGLVTSSEGDVLRTLEIENLRYSVTPMVLNTDQWGNLHLKYMEHHPDYRTRILDPQGNLLSIEDPSSPVYNQTYRLNLNSTSRSYSGTVEVEGEHPVYLLDSEGNTWIASVDSEAYLTVADDGGRILVEGDELDAIPESIPGYLTPMVIGTAVIVCVAAILVWLRWYTKSRRETA